MRASLALVALLALSAVTLAPVAAADPCDRDPITQQSPCEWHCTGDPQTCRLLAIVLFPCSQPWINC